MNDIADAKSWLSDMAAVQGDARVIEALLRDLLHECEALVSQCEMLGHVYTKDTRQPLPNLNPLLDISRKVIAKAKGES